MNTPRTTLLADKQDLKSLWKICFEDSDQFIHWFFNFHFSPAHSVCLEEDKKIVSAMYALPMHIKIRNRILPCAILSGFSTLPEYRGRGYMRQCFLYLASRLKKAGIVVMAHTPAVLESYYSLGHYPATTSAYFDSEQIVNTILPSGLSFLDPSDDISYFWDCYQQFSTSYSGILSRSLADFRLKFEDYSSDGGKAFCFMKKGQIKGYTVYYDTPTLVHGEEIVALDSQSEATLISGLMHLAKGKKLHFKLPPDTKFMHPNLKKEIRPMGVMGLVSLPLLLKKCGYGLDYIFSVHDKIIEENNGCYNLRGQPMPVSSAQIEINAGYLLQFLVGYSSLEELKLQNKVKILDEAAAKQLDLLFPKQTCFIIDEY